MTIDATSVAALAEALASGASVADADLAALASTTDILTLGMLADDLRRTRCGADVTYVRVADVSLPLAEGFVVPPAAREVRVELAAVAVDEQAGALATAAAIAGDVPVSACSLADLESAAAGRDGVLARRCATLRAAGVSAVAEAPLDLLADPVTAWAAAREAGLAVARVTVARNTDASGRLALLQRLAALQRAGGPVSRFAPLARAWTPGVPSTGYEDVRHVALARLLASGVTSIQVDWALYGPKLAQVALTMGADDLDGVTADDDAPHGRRRAPVEEVLRNIRAAGLTPVERDGLGRRTAA